MTSLNETKLTTSDREAIKTALSDIAEDIVVRNATVYMHFKAAHVKNAARAALLGAGFYASKAYDVRGKTAFDLTRRDFAREQREETERKRTLRWLDGLEATDREIFAEVASKTEVITLDEAMNKSHELVSKWVEWVMPAEHAHQNSVIIGIAQGGAVKTDAGENRYWYEVTTMDMTTLEVNPTTVLLTKEYPVIVRPKAADVHVEFMLPRNLKHRDYESVRVMFKSDLRNERYIYVKRDILGQEKATDWEYEVSMRSGGMTVEEWGVYVEETEKCFKIAARIASVLNGLSR